MWLPNAGLILNINGILNIVTYDGVAVPVSSQDITQLWGLGTGNQLLHSSANQTTYVKDNQALCSLAVTDQRAFPPSGVQSYVDVPSRRIYYNNGSLYSGLGAFSLEAASPMSDANGLVGQGRNPLEVFVNGHSGNDTVSFSFYDTVGRSFGPLQTTGFGGVAAVYCTDLGVVLTLHSNPAQIRIWALEDVPSILSQPILLSGLVSQGQMATFQVTATDIVGLNVSGYPVSWSVSEGTIVNTSGTTDEYGNASVQVSFDHAVTGNCVVTATVTI